MDKVFKEYGEPMTGEYKPGVRINILASPMGVSRSTSGLEGVAGTHNGDRPTKGDADLKSARINTNSTPRGVTRGGKV